MGENDNKATEPEKEKPGIITGTVAIKLDPLQVANMLRQHWKGQQEKKE